MSNNDEVEWPALELMNADAYELENEFGDEIENVDIAEGAPIPGDPWTTYLIVTAVGSAAVAAGKRAGELIVEDIHGYLQRRYEEWKFDYSEASEPISPDDLPYRHVIEIRAYDQEGDLITSFSNIKDREEEKEGLEFEGYF